jgi:hypothetical protein
MSDTGNSNAIGGCEELPEHRCAMIDIDVRVGIGSSDEEERICSRSREVVMPEIPIDLDIDESHVLPLPAGEAPGITNVQSSWSLFQVSLKGFQFLWPGLSRTYGNTAGKV